MAKKPKLVRVRLNGGPYDSNLFCPYCGAQILEPDAEEIGECPHLVYSAMEEDPEEAEDEEFLPNDLCFVFFEPAPASREHYFVFREGNEPGDDEEAED